MPRSAAANPESARTTRWLLALELLLPAISLAIATSLATLVVRVAGGQTLTASWTWVPSLDVSLSFHLDGLSLLFALLISGTGVFVFTYAPAYLGKHPDRARLYGWLFVFMLAMLGLVLSNNVITLFVFWELTSVASYMLIGFNHNSDRARAAALQALLVTGLGGLALLAGLLLLAETAGTYELTTLVAESSSITESPALGPIVVLILVGAFTKSAQFPFHFWLPNAMQAPTPVSAYLHSATMVKAGIYLVARLSPAFSGVVVWDYLVIAIGSLTALLGGFLSLRQTDLKRVLAYSTVSALGVMMLLLGIGTVTAIKACLVFLVCHALYKGAMFMIVGTVDHATGTRDLRELGGLGRAMPMVACAAACAALSKMGLPPAGGFLAKELVYESALSTPGWSLPVLLVVFGASVSFVAVGGLVAVGPFFRGRRSEIQVHRVSIGLTLPPLLLASLGILVGAVPAPFGEYLIGPAVSAIDGQTQLVALKLWHGLNLPLLLSTVTLIVGISVYLAAPRLGKTLARFDWLTSWGPSAGYETALRWLKSSATLLTRTLQNGRLRVYLLVVLTTFIATVGSRLMGSAELPSAGTWLELKLYELFIPALIICSTLMAVYSESRLAAVCALGVIGYAMAMLFVMFGAPDLAMTQLAIETLTVVLFVLVIYRLPRFASLSSRASRLRDALVAITAGSVMTIVVLAATAAHAPSRVSQFFADNSLAAAKGRNMVNVILVDFRGMDTLGEITVLAIAAIGIFALMNLRPGTPQKAENSPWERTLASPPAKRDPIATSVEQVSCSTHRGD